MPDLGAHVRLQVLLPSGARRGGPLAPEWRLRSHKRAKKPLAGQPGGKVRVGKEEAWTAAAYKIPISRCI
jgi:hypothetical protein